MRGLAAAALLAAAAAAALLSPVSAGVMGVDLGSRDFKVSPRAMCAVKLLLPSVTRCGGRPPLLLPRALVDPR